MFSNHLEQTFQLNKNNSIQELLWYEGELGINLITHKELTEEIKNNRNTKGLTD